MKRMMLVVLVTLAPLAAMAEMTKGEVIRLGALAMVKTNLGKQVEGCSGRTSDLLTCVFDNTNMSSDFSKLPMNATVTKKVTLSYFDQSGDCTTSVTVDAHNKTVTRVGKWSCE